MCLRLLRTWFCFSVVLTIFLFRVLLCGQNTILAALFYLLARRPARRFISFMIRNKDLITNENKIILPWHWQGSFWVSHDPACHHFFGTLQFPHDDDNDWWWTWYTLRAALQNEVPPALWMCKKYMMRSECALCCKVNAKRSFNFSFFIVAPFKVKKNDANIYTRPTLAGGLYLR